VEAENAVRAVFPGHGDLGVGCGDEKSSPESKEDAKQKQQVVQEKMKEYMQKKAKTKGPGR
jgi:hypothetical protein